MERENTARHRQGSVGHVGHWLAASDPIPGERAGQIFHLYAVVLGRVSVWGRELGCGEGVAAEGDSLTQKVRSANHTCGLGSKLSLLGV